MPNSTTQEIKNLFSIAIGALLLASGLAFFLLPAQVATGGTPGMAMIIHFMTGISTGIAILIVNVPLIALGMKFIDLRFALRTIFAIIITGLGVDYLDHFIDFPQINSLLLSTLYGGTCIGAGISFVLKGQASAGGTTIIAKIVSEYSHIKPGQIIMFLDGAVIITIGILFGDMEIVLWSMLSIYATTQVIDKILTGAIPEKIVHIVSPNAVEIGEHIHQELKRDGTILNGQNIKTNTDKTILFVVVDARRLPTLKNMVLKYDPAALMIVMEASEILGTSRRLS